MPSEQRLHPLSILFAFAGSLKAFAVPGLLVLFAGRSSSGGPGGSFGRFSPNWEIWMMLLLIPAGLAAIARYLSFRIRYESSDLIIRSGIIFRNERHIPYSRIQNLEAVRNVFHRAFGVVEVRVENASGKETEAKISVLPLAAFEEMRRRVFEGKSRGAPTAPAETVTDQPTTGPGPAAVAGEVTLLRLSVRDLLLCGFLENRGLIVVGAIYGFLWEFGPVGGLWNRIMDQGSYGSGVVRETVRSLWSGESPPLGTLAVAAAGVVGFLLLVRGVSMAWAVVRLYGFHLTRAGEDLRTEFGLFTRVSTTIPLRRIQTMTIREGPLYRRLGRVAVRVETAGGAQAKPGAIVDREWLAPLVRTRELPSLVREVIPGLDLGGIDWQPVHPRAFRRAVKPAIVFAVAVVAAPALWVGWMLPLLPVSVAWFVLVTRKHVDHLSWAETDDAVLFRSGWLWRVLTIARVPKIQAVTMRESPFDRRTAMARVRVDTAGASERSVRVDIPYLPRDVAGQLHHRLAAGAARTDFRW